MRVKLAEATIPSVNLYGYARDLTITIYRENRQGWNRKTQSSESETLYLTVGSGATQWSQGNGTEADARQSANTMFSWYVGLSELHPTFKENREWTLGDRTTRRPW